MSVLRDVFAGAKSPNSSRSSSSSSSGDGGGGGGSEGTTENSHIRYCERTSEVLM